MPKKKQLSNKQKVNELYTAYHFLKELFVIALVLVFIFFAVWLGMELFS